MNFGSACRLLLANPFPVSAPKRERAAELVIQRSERLQGTRGLPLHDQALALAVAFQQLGRTQRDEPFRRALQTRLGPKSELLAKPVLRQLLACAAASERCMTQLRRLKGDSAAMGQLRQHVWSACFGATLAHARQLHQLIHDHDILLLGETGTGKETVAHAIMAGAIPHVGHQHAPTSKINVAEVPESLIESELFGHVKGAYTGATQTRPGRIRSASGGCFFLDEVGDLSLQIQVKLLRVIETDEVNPVGSDQNHPASVRYIAATHQNLPKMVEEGTFRRDLFERLAGDVIRLPPLRARPEDIPTIGLSLVELYPVRDEDHQRIETWLNSDEVKSRAWLGNVRELHNAIRSMMLGLVPATPPAAEVHGVASEPHNLPKAIVDRSASLDEVRDWYLQQVTLACGGNQTAIAKRLGVDRTTVRRWMQRR